MAQPVRRNSLDSTNSRNDYGETATSSQFDWETELSTMFETHPEVDDLTLGQRGRTRVANYLRRFQGALRGKRLVHDIVPATDFARSEELLARCLKHKYHGGCFIWVFHDDHCHVIHDCSWSAGYCRCTRLNGLPIKKHRRVFKRIIGLHNRVLFFLTKYLLEHPRRISYFEYAGRNRQPPSEIISLRYEELEGISEEFVVEGSEFVDNIYYSEPCRSNENSTRSSSGSSSQKSQNHSRYEGRNKKEELLEFLWDHAVCPILNITNTNVWINSKYRYLTRQHEDFRIVCNLFQLQVCQKPYAELCDHLFNSSPLFYAYLQPFDEVYYTIAESLIIAERLLAFQVGEGNIRVFLTDVYNILERRIPKCNCLFVLGEPNSGKNFYFDSIIASCIASGQIGNFNRFNNFPLMECVNKRILLWNEPNCEPGAFDTLKMLFGGDSLSVRVKYEADAVVLRTPIIVLSNTNPFPSDNAFNTRMIRYRWHAASFLQEYTKKLHPLTTYCLLQSYNLLEQ